MLPKATKKVRIFEMYIVYLHLLNGPRIAYQMHTYTHTQAPIQMHICMFVYEYNHKYV